MPTTYCRFYIVRHAQSEGNARRIVQGHADFPLTELGKQQALQRRNDFKSISFDQCYASDLLRTRQTAEILTENLTLPLLSSQLLREQNFGRYNGAEAEFFERELDPIITAHRSLTKAEQFSQRPHPEVESDSEMMWRMQTFLRSIATVNAGKNILAVTHGGIMRSLLAALNYATYEQMRHTAIGNCGYIVLDCDGQNFIVNQLEDIEILASPSD